MKLKIGGIYVLKSYTAILIEENKYYLFVVVLLNDTLFNNTSTYNQKIIINILNNLSKNNIEFHLIDKSSNYFIKNNTGYLGQISQTMLKEFKDLLIETNWYNRYR